MKQRKKTLRKTSLFPYLLITIGFIMLSFWAMHRYFYTQSISLSDRILASYTRENSNTSIPSIITVNNIPRLNIVESAKTNNRWPVSNTAANHVYQSAFPGEPGNIIIYGHNTDSIFGNLYKIHIGDEINIVTINGKNHAYIVSEIVTVPTTRTELLAPTTHEVLTLYTCAGFLDSMRLVVRAIPKFDSAK